MNSSLTTAEASQGLWTKGSAATPINDRPLRVCFISTNAYGLLRPASGLPFGGAEVQITGLAREMARDPRFEIFILTGDRGRVGREREDGMTIVLDALCGGNQANYWSPGPGADGKAVSEEGAFCALVAKPIIGAKQIVRWLDRGPVKVATFLRALLRVGYSCRDGLKSFEVVRWLVHRIRECREVIKWYRVFRSIGADVYVMRCASLQVSHMQRACALLRRRFVYMVAHQQDVSGDYARSHGVLGKLYEGGLKRADAIVCQHADQVPLIRSRYHRDARLIRSLCPFPVAATSDAPRRTILWIARVESWKQPDLFLELAKRMPDQSFVMVGAASQNEPQNLPRLLERGKDLPNLRFLPGIPFANTATLFEDAMIFVNTSMNEGFPNTFLQAAACGTPTVSWTVNPEGILERYEMGYCANGDWDRFERCIRLLCADAALREKIGENARRYVQEQHDPAVIAREFGELCLALGNKRKVAAVQTQSVTTT
jgi:glycosyltransferase involved in cell wall biosynthesis